MHGAGVGTRRDGVWASAAVVPSRALTEVPDGVDLDQAATDRSRGSDGVELRDRGREGQRQMIASWSSGRVAGWGA